jgi:predicted CXXCH cytochrome family protein
MLLKNTKQSTVQQITISWLITFTIVCMAQLAFGGAIVGTSIMTSQGPCAFSVQLQKSVSVRKRYLVKLSALTGGPASSGGAVEDMYSNIKQASYNPDVAAPDEDDLWGFGSTATKEPAGLDPFSTDCMCCHDGAGAVSVAVDWRNNPAGLRSLRTPHGTDHPIGMDYESYVASRSRDYKPVTGLNSKMIFVNGRVGCLTCHDPLNPERGHLVMSDRQSALCLTCHGK